MYGICIFYYSGFLSNLRLPWKTELPWNFSLYWNIFLSSRIFEQLAFALKTELRWNFSNPRGRLPPPDPSPRTPMCTRNHMFFIWRLWVVRVHINRGATKGGAKGAVCPPNFGWSLSNLREKIVMKMWNQLFIQTGNSRPKVIFLASRLNINKLSLSYFRRRSPALPVITILAKRSLVFIFWGRWQGLHSLFVQS